jgi:hypothetical protein
MLEKLADRLIEEAMRRGEFDNLPGRGRRVDLTAYFETPEDVRTAYSLLKEAGFAPREAEILNELARKMVEAANARPAEAAKIRRQIEGLRLEWRLRQELRGRKGNKKLTKRLRGGL